MNPALSVVAPVRDELANLAPLVEELSRVLPRCAPSWELLLVDDGSRDGSTAEIARLAAADERVRGLFLRRPRGQTAALDAGLRAARGSVVVTLDADGQSDPGEIPRLLEALAAADAVVGYRRVRRDGWWRRVTSRAANAIRNRVSGDDIVDTGCALRAIRRECLPALKLWTGLHRFLPTLLRQEGFRVLQIPVNHRPRLAGRSKYGVLDRAFVSFADLLVVRWMGRRRLGYELVERPAVSARRPADRAAASARSSRGG